MWLRSNIGQEPLDSAIVCVVHKSVLETLNFKSLMLNGRGPKLRGPNLIRGT